MTARQFPVGRVSTVVVLTLVLSNGCAKSPDNLATFGSQTLTVADLDAYLLTRSESERQMPVGGDPDEWMEDHLRRLALERVLESSTEMAELAASPEVTAARQRMREGLLTSALQRQLAETAVPSAEEVAAKAAELAGRRSGEPVLNFQHAFFRLDRGGDLKAIRARAEKVAAEARADADFSALVREHSDSANAASGGLVSNVRPSDLDPTSAAALAALDEGEVSEVIETRTGLHVLRLIRRLEPEPPSPAQLEVSARSLLQQERLAAAHDELLTKLGASDSDTGDNDNRQQLLVAEAAARGLETPEMAEQVERMIHLQLLERLFNLRRWESDAKLGEDVLRPFYDAQPLLFTTTEKVRASLIFVPQGADSFATQKQLEKRVEALRAGASFADVAREISEHPSAAEGGDLGLHPAAELAHYGPTIAATAADLEVGEISDPVYCTGRVLSHDPRLLRAGFAVLRLEEREPARERSFEEAIDDVRQAYAGQNRERLDEQIQDRILTEAGFEILRLPKPDEFLQ